MNRRYQSMALAVIALFAFWAIKTTFAHEGHKHSNAPASAKKLKNPLTVDDQNVAAGRQLFNKYCAVCHGEDGKSKTESAAKMKKKPADLTAKEMHGITDGEIYWVVANGISKNAMPAFKSKTGNNERWQLTLYVKHLMGEHDNAAQTAENSASQGKQDHGDHHTGVNTRGDQVMGFSHEKTTHHFRLKTDGGVIEVNANDPDDTASREQIRTHLKHITQKFSAGDFTAPMLIHAQDPPGVSVMKQLKVEIIYQFEETERGARVRVLTKNPKALAAIHDFLRFQISDHKTGDPVEVEKP